VGDAGVTVIVDDAPLKVSPVVVAIFQLLDRLIADAPSVSVRVFELLELNIVQVTDCPLVFRLPLVSVMDDVDNHVVDNVQPPPTPLNATLVAPSVTPLVDTVLPVVVAAKVILAPEVGLNATPVAAFNQDP
jgi:hypothetical protein